MRSRLYAATVNPKRTEIFTRPKTRKNPRAQSTNEPFKAGVGRLDDLAAVHRYPPCRGTKRDDLGQGKLDSRCRQAATTTPGVLRQRHHGFFARAAHGLRQAPGPEKTSAERTSPAGEPVCVGTAVADIAPPGATVEGIFEGAPVGPAGKAGWHGEVAEFGWQESRVELTVKQERLA